MNVYTRREVLADGLEFLATLVESDGTERTDVASGTISVWKMSSGSPSYVVEDVALTQLNDSTWKYDWHPSSVSPGDYYLEFVMHPAGDVIRLYEEFEVVSDNANQIYFSIPTGGYTVNNPSEVY